MHSFNGPFLRVRGECFYKTFNATEQKTWNKSDDIIIRAQTLYVHLRVSARSFSRKCAEPRNTVKKILQRNWRNLQRFDLFENTPIINLTKLLQDNRWDSIRVTDNSL